MRSIRTLSALAAAAGILNAGCGAKPRDETAPSPTVLKASAAAAPFAIVATDTGFEAPDRIPTGLRHVVYENRGSAIHEAMLVKLPADMTADGYVAAVNAGALFPKGALDFSGPGLTSPGERTELWLRVVPGRYLLMCWNHARSTHVHPFTVESGAADDDEPPQTDVVVNMRDYHFEVEGTLRKGEQVIRIETPGPSMHEVDLFRLHEGKTAQDLVRWRKLEGEGAAPAQALGGALDSHDIRNVVWLRKTFTPGRYALLCEMPLAGSAPAGTTTPTHSDLGMVREFEITD